jgi:hypothetical protein
MIKMTRERALALEGGEAEFTKEELEENWHICWEWDGMATPGEVRDEDGSCSFCGHNYKKHLGEMNDAEQRN